MRDLENLPSDCGEEVAEFPSIKPAMKSSLEFLAQLAWGVGAPKSTFERLGWMDQSQLSIFCRMKAQYARRFGKENFDILREQTIQKLPGAAELGREEAWRRSLFSASCSF